MFSIAWDIDFPKVNETFFQTAQEHNDAVTIKKLRKLVTNELVPQKLDSALRILNGLDPEATPAEGRASDVSCDISSNVFFFLNKLSSVL